MIVFCLLKYGWHGIYALTACIKQVAEREKYEIYTANALGAIVTRLFRWSGATDFEFPLYSELGKPKPEEKNGQEIVDGLINKLTGRVVRADGFVHAIGEADA